MVKKMKKMKKQISVFTMMMLFMCLPIVIIDSVTSGMMLIMGDPYSLIDGDLNLLCINFLRLVGMIMVVVFGAQKINKKILIIDDQIERNLKIIPADITNATTEKSRFQLDQLIQNSQALTGYLEAFLKQAEGLSKGNFRRDKNIADDTIESKNAITLTERSLEKLHTEISRAAENVEKGDYVLRCTAEDLSQDFRQIITDVNRIITALVGRVEFFETVLDAMPFPVHVMDNEMRWLHMNKGLEVALHQAGILTDEMNYCGVACSHANNPVCNTKQCGIRQLTETGNGETTFVLAGQHVKLECFYLTDKTGKTIGFIEVCSDITAIDKVNAYTRLEVDRFEKNLLRLAEGNLDFDLNIGPADNHTKEIAGQFLKIGQSLSIVKESLSGMVTDISMIANAAIEGKLEARADEKKFKGAWQKLVVGINGILAEIEKPLIEIRKTIEAMSKGDVECLGSGRISRRF